MAERVSKKDMPRHKWYVKDTVRFDNSGRYVYACAKCKTTVLDGDPLSPTQLEKCGK